MKATGIQIDGPIFRRATVNRIGQDLRIDDLKTITIGDGKVKQLYFDSDSGALVSGLASNDLIIRSFSFIPAKSRKLKQALILQTEAQLHLKPEELLTIAVIDAKEKRATAYSTTKSALAAHLQPLNALQLDPERISAIPAALKTFIRWKAPEIASYFLVDIGMTATNCIWVEKNELQKAHAIPLGFQNLRTAFLEDRKKMISLQEPGKIDFTALKTSQYPTLAEEARSFRREISKLLHSFQCQRPLIFTGELESNGFREFLLETLRDCISEDKKIDLSDDEHRHASCLGLAMDYLLNREQPIQFRTGSMLTPRNWQKLGLFAVGLFCAAAGFWGMVFGFGSWWMTKRENEIVQSLETWTAAKDPELRMELFSAGSDTKELVNQWLKLIDKNANDYRFLMKAPRVLTFLNWLTHHPLIDSFRSSGDAMSFDQIRYQLVSFPRLEATQDPYLVKVEIEFKVASPLHARKFHEMLLQGEGMVDASHEATWEVFPDRYKACFYLKNE
jgi:hypothetical protein